MNGKSLQEEERLKVLQMVEEGKINAGEAASLLSALNREPKASRTISPQTENGPRWFRVRVTDTQSGKSKAIVNIPIGLMEWGLRIGAQYAPEVADLDLQEISQILRSGVNGKLVEVIDEEDGEHVEIFVE